MRALPRGRPGRDRRGAKRPRARPGKQQLDASLDVSPSHPPPFPVSGLPRQDRRLRPGRRGRDRTPGVVAFRALCSFHPRRTPDQTRFNPEHRLGGPIDPWNRGLPHVSRRRKRIASPHRFGLCSVPQLPQRSLRHDEPSAARNSFRRDFQAPARRTRVTGQRQEPPSSRSRISRVVIDA